MTMDIKKYEMLAQVIENSMTKEIRDQSVKSVPKNSPINYHLFMYGYILVSMFVQKGAMLYYTSFRPFIRIIFEKTMDSSRKAAGKDKNTA